MVRPSPCVPYRLRVIVEIELETRFEVEALEEEGPPNETERPEEESSESDPLCDGEFPL